MVGGAVPGESAGGKGTGGRGEAPGVSQSRLPGERQLGHLSAGVGQEEPPLGVLGSLSPGMRSEWSV